MYIPIIIIVLIGWYVASQLLPRSSDRHVSAGALKKARVLAKQFEEDSGDSDAEEADDVVEPAGETVKNPTKDLDKSKLVRLAAAHVRAKVWLLKRNQANAAVVRKLVCDFLDGRKDLRKTHYLRIVPYAVELAFIPTIYDIEARDFAASADWVERRDEYDADRVVEAGVGLFGLFGKTIRRTKPPVA